jgi:hypothetical protein
MGRLVSNVTIAALIAAGSGLVGGLLAATAARSVERFRVSAALLEKAEERRLSSIEAFMLAATAWLDWLEYIEELGWKDIPDKDLELNRRVKARDEAYRRLLLLASEQLRHWLVEVYTPVEREVRRTYSDQLRMVGHIDDSAKAAHHEYKKLLGDKFVEIARAEIQGLRDPRKLRVHTR